MAKTAEAAQDSPAPKAGMVRVKNLVSWAGRRGFSARPGQLIDLPKDVAEARIAKGLAAEVTDLDDAQEKAGAAEQRAADLEKGLKAAKAALAKLEGLPAELDGAKKALEELRDKAADLEAAKDAAEKAAAEATAARQRVEKDNRDLSARLSALDAPEQTIKNLEKELGALKAKAEPKPKAKAKEADAS